LPQESFLAFIAFIGFIERSPRIRKGVIELIAFIGFIAFKESSALKSSQDETTPQPPPAFLLFHLFLFSCLLDSDSYLLFSVFFLVPFALSLKPYFLIMTGW